MTENRAGLERECRTFTKLLSGRAANAYLLEKYLAAHRQSGALREREGFDTRLLRAAAGTPAIARVADGYARWFFPSGTLRKKLVLTLALVEVTPPYSQSVEGAPQRSPISALAHLVLAGLSGGFCVVLGIMAFGPLDLAFRLAGRRK